MITKKFSKLMLIALLAATVAGAAAAQDGGPAGNGGKGGRGPGGRGGMGGRGLGQLTEIVQKVAEETELTVQEVTQSLFNGDTVADILTANGDDPEAFVTAVLADAKTRLDAQVTDGKLTQEQADQRLTDAEADLRAFVFDGTLPTPAENGGQLGQRRPLVELGQIIIEQAGLDPVTVRESLRAGQSLTAQIEAAGKDVATVKQASIDAATKAINEAVTAGTVTQERADEMISNLETVVDRLLSADLQPGGGEFGGMRGEGRQLSRAVADATGLTVEEVRAEVEAGKTLADVLTSKDITVESFIDTQLETMKTRLDARVANGTMSQALADARLELARVELTERLNGTFQPKNPAGEPAPMTTPEATAESQS